MEVTELGIVTVVMPVHPSKVCLPMEEMELGIVIEPNPLHP